MERYQRPEAETEIARETEIQRDRDSCFKDDEDLGFLMCLLPWLLLLLLQYGDT